MKDSEALKRAGLACMDYYPADDNLFELMCYICKEYEAAVAAEEDVANG